MNEVVYFLQNPQNTHIKIGYTKTFKRRYRAHCRDYGVKLTILGVMDGGWSLETQLHSQFASHNVINEWFLPHQDILNFIAQNAHQDLSRLSAGHQKTYGENMVATVYLGKGDNKQRRIERLDEMAKERGISRSILICLIADGTIGLSDVDESGKPPKYVKTLKRVPTY